MKRLWYGALLATIGTIIGFLGLSLSARAAGSESAAASADYAPLVDDYMAGKWDEVDAALQARAKESGKAARPEPADLLYIKAALLQCRPAWWKVCKAGKKYNFSPALWDRQLDCTFDPAIKQGVQFQSVQGRVHLTVAWNTKEMDDPAQAEHGFTRGELNQLLVWMNLGSGEAWSELPNSAFSAADEAQKLTVQRFIDFRGNVSGAYYAIPRARRWAMWLCTAAYMDRYAKMQTVMARQAIGAMLVEEVVGHREAYPSIRLPDKMPADRAEREAALALKAWIEKHPWTFAEDRALREVIKRLAATNGKAVAASGVVALGNGLSMALDPQRDGAFRAKRDAWVAARMPGVEGGK